MAWEEYKIVLQMQLGLNIDFPTLVLLKYEILLYVVYKSVTYKKTCTSITKKFDRPVYEQISESREMRSYS